MAKLKLLFYVEHFRAATGGLESAAVQLCRALAHRGYDVHILADDGDDLDDVTVHTDGLDNRVTLEGRLLPDLCIDWGFFHPAHLHRLGGGTHRGFIDYNLDAYSGIPLLFRRMRYRSVKHRSIIAREQAILRNPRAQFLANSKLTAGLAVADGANPERVTVHHNGVNLKHYNPERIAEYRGSVRRDWGLADDDIAFLFIAHNLRLKNLDLMLQVFSKLDPALKAKLVVIGKRDPGKTASWLVYAGATAAMDQFYAAGDALVHPTYFDSCANVILEAMACGLPVVVSDTCGVNELIADGENGRVLAVRENAAAAWSAEVAALAADDDLRRARGAAARALAAENGFDAYMDWFDQYLQDVYATKEREAGGG